MNVSMWMTRDVRTVGPDTPVTEAAQLMAGEHIRRLPVWSAGRTGTICWGSFRPDVIHAFPPHVNHICHRGAGCAADADQGGRDHDGAAADGVAGYGDRDRGGDAVRAQNRRIAGAAR